MFIKQSIETLTFDEAYTFGVLVSYMPYMTVQLSDVAIRIENLKSLDAATNEVAYYCYYFNRDGLVKTVKEI
jgi:small nuclear ribonucleoprotein (snRNP)-like protein